MRWFRKGGWAAESGQVRDRWWRCVGGVGGGGLKWVEVWCRGGGGSGDGCGGGSGRGGEGYVVFSAVSTFVD